MMGSRCEQLDSHTAGASPSFECIVLQFTCYGSFYRAGALLWELKRPRL
jgi:hypothetical protein